MSKELALDYQQIFWSDFAASCEYAFFPLMNQIVEMNKQQTQSGSFSLQPTWNNRKTASISLCGNKPRWTFYLFSNSVGHQDTEDTAAQCMCACKIHVSSFELQTASMVNHVWEVSGAPSSSGAPLSSCTSSTALMCHWNSTTLKWSIIKGTSLMGPSLWGPVTVPSDKSTARRHGRVSMVLVQSCRFHVCSTKGRSVLIACDSWLGKWCFHSWGRGSVDKVRIQNTRQLDVWCFGCALRCEQLEESFFYFFIINILRFKLGWKVA